MKLDADTALLLKELELVSDGPRTPSGPITVNHLLASLRPRLNRKRSRGVLDASCIDEARARLAATANLPIARVTSLAALPSIWDQLMVGPPGLHNLRDALVHHVLQGGEKAEDYLVKHAANLAGPMEVVASRQEVASRVCLAAAVEAVKQGANVLYVDCRNAITGSAVQDTIVQVYHINPNKLTREENRAIVKCMDSLLIVKPFGAAAVLDALVQFEASLVRPLKKPSGDSIGSSNDGSSRGGEGDGTGSSSTHHAHLAGTTTATTTDPTTRTAAAAAAVNEHTEPPRHALIVIDSIYDMLVPHTLRGTEQDSPSLPRDTSTSDTSSTSNRATATHIQAALSRSTHTHADDSRTPAAATGAAPTEAPSQIRDPSSSPQSSIPLDCLSSSSVLPSAELISRDVQLALRRLARLGTGILVSNLAAQPLPPLPPPPSLPSSSSRHAVRRALLSEEWDDFFEAQFFVDGTQNIVCYLPCM